MKLIHSIALLGAISVAAQAAVTDPVGFVTIPITGTGGGNPTGLQLASQQLLPSGSVEFVGQVDSFTGTTLTDADGTWAAGDYVNPTPPAGFPNFTHLVEILDGALEGTYTWISGSAVGSLTTHDDISAAGAASYRIVRAFTVETMIGATGGPLAGAGSAGAADNLLLFDSETNSYTTFYYKNAGILGGTGWRTSASNSVNVASVAIHPTDSGLVFVRKQASDTSLVITGEVKTGVTDVLIRGGGGTGPGATTLNLVQALVPTDQITLGTSGLYTGDAGTGLLGGGSAGAADNVLVYDSATNLYTTYYYKDSGILGGTGWRSSASNSVDESATVLPSTSAILIQRKATGLDFTWEIPEVTIAP